MQHRTHIGLVDVAVIGSGFAGFTCFAHLKQALPSKAVVLIEKGPPLDMSLEDRTVPYLRGLTLLARYASVRQGIQGSTLVPEWEGGASSFTQLCLHDDLTDLAEQLRECGSFDVSQLLAICLELKTALAELSYTDSPLTQAIIAACQAAGLRHNALYEASPVARQSFGIPSRYYKASSHTTIMDSDQAGDRQRGKRLTSTEVLKMALSQGLLRGDAKVGCLGL